LCKPVVSVDSVEMGGGGGGTGDPSQLPSLQRGFKPLTIPRALHQGVSPIMLDTWLGTIHPSDVNIMQGVCCHQPEQLPSVIGNDCFALTLVLDFPPLHCRIQYF